MPSQAVDAFITMQAQRLGGAMMGAYSASHSAGERNRQLRALHRKGVLAVAVWRFFILIPTSIKVSLCAGGAGFPAGYHRAGRLQRRRRYLVVGWFWFLGTLVPMIGLVQVGVQAMADRYAYLPFIGLFIMICWGVADWSQERHVSPAWLAALSIGVLVALTVTARVQLDYWRDNITVWSHTLQVTGPNFIAENSIGVSLDRADRMEEAVTHFRAALAIKPDDAASNLNLAEYDRRHGNLMACIDRCKRVPAMTQLTREKVAAYAKMALAYHSLGDTASEQECLREVQRLQFGQ